MQKPSFVTNRPDSESVQLERDLSDGAKMHPRESDSARDFTNQPEEEEGV